MAARIDAATVNAPAKAAAPVAKLDLLRAAWARGDKIGALRIASRFGDRSPETQVFKRGWDAHSNRSFYCQLGKEPDALIDAAFAAMARKFKL